MLSATSASTNESDKVNVASVSLTHDPAINYAFQQNAIPVIKELRFQNDGIPRKDVLIRVSTEPTFAPVAEVRLQSIEADQTFRVAPLDLKLSHDFLVALDERLVGWLKVEVFHAGQALCSVTEPISLLARNEWCGLVSLPEILAAFILPNDPAVMTVLGRASDLLREHTARGSFTGYQDKNRKRAWEQVAAIYRAIGELGIRYIVPPASFETTGQKVRLPSDILEQRFGTCLDLALLFAACCEQAGLRPLVLIHDGHAYAGCWLEERMMPEPSSDDLQHVRKLVTEELITVFETTVVAGERPGTLKDAERGAKEHLLTEKTFRLFLDVHGARGARIHPLPIPGAATITAGAGTAAAPELVDGLGDREFNEAFVPPTAKPATAAGRIDHWKSRLLDLSLRNRALNFKETKSTIQILAAAPEKIEDHLAADTDLVLQSKPRFMSERDPRDAATYSKQQRADALALHLEDELAHGRLHTHLDDAEHSKRLTELYRAARTAMEENGTNTLFAAVGILEWRETEHADRVLRAPLLLVPVQLIRKSVLEGFSLRRLDEETRINVTLMEMLRQHFHKSVTGLDPLPEDDSGVDVPRVFRIFRDAVRNLAGWEVREEVWLGQFSFTKFLLWNDLNTRLDRLIQNPIVNHLVHRAGSSYPRHGEDIQPSELDRRFHPREVFCPRSADSSQLAAVMAAAEGQDFVLEGPPGTGKSQTITNIIAHCLAEGKRVLFVAEKRAALDVVHRRLRESGLDAFCLELHSNKVGKADVLAQFDRTLKLVNKGGAAEWEERASELGRMRDELNEYTRVLHVRHSCGLSAYQCLDYLLPRQKEPTVRLSGAPSIIETSAVELERSRDVSRLMQERTRELMPLAGHPLTLLACEDWTPAWAEQASVEVQELIEVTRAAIREARDLCGWMDRPTPVASRSELAALSELVETLLAPRAVGPGFATTPWSQLRPLLDTWAALTRERREMRSALTEIHEALPPGTIASLPESWSDVQADDALRQAGELRRITSQLDGLARELRAWLRAPDNYRTREQLAHLDAVVDCLLKIPVDVGAKLAIARWEETAKHVAHWASLARERTVLRNRLASFDEARLLALELDDLDRVWRSASGAWFLPKWIRTRKVRRAIRPARRDGTRLEASEVGSVLVAALRLRTINQEIDQASEGANALLGPTWCGGEPDPEKLDRVRAWGQTLHARLHAASADQPDWSDGLRSRVAEILAEGNSTFAGAGASAALLARYREVLAAFQASFMQTVSSASLRRCTLESSTDHLAAVATTSTALLRAAPRVRSSNSSLVGAATAAQQCLGVLWNHGEPSADAIADARTWGDALHARLSACTSGDLEWLGRLRQLLAGLFAEGPTFYAAKTSVGSRLERFRDALPSFDSAFQRVTARLRLRRDPPDVDPDHLETVLKATIRIEGAWPSIRAWCSWQRARHQAIDLRLGPVVSALESASDNTLNVPDLFERSFRRSLLFTAIGREPALREFFGNEHNQRIERFREFDDRYASLTRDLVQARLAAAIPRENRKADHPPEEMALLRKEIGKKMRHIPVRQLLGRIPNLLPRLKPCVLMSPLSVAQFLDASKEQFDVVVFDEASQIPVWDAVGAIARGKQLIVVGDPKQLPPTNFFNTTEDDEDDLTPDEHKDLESILDELLSNGVRHKRLQWHYRSRHEGLITFSNRLYYHNDLLTFPSPTTEHGGVRFMHQPHARYDKGKSRTNRGEAEALVKELVARLRAAKGPERSYGVVTFSQAQQQLVENLLDEERRKYPEIEYHFGDDPPVEGEPVFVKNLENVQGDERDVILFSICYGPDETGRVSMNFGPLNRDGGERRLNVAVTRAKHEVLVISGLRADQIDLTRTRAKGVRDLKYFLDYAERGPRALAAATSASADAEEESEFERMVADRIRAAGFEVHHQVGCSDYRIDLGVVDPRAPGRYLLGVECDGATYHRAATARDRDKLRLAVLEGLGWTLHRVWSTDWWHDADSETAKLLSRLDAANLERIQ